MDPSQRINFIDWGEYDQRMNIMTASGEPMDMFFTSNWTNDYITMVNKGALQPIPFEKIQRLAPNMINTIPEKLWSAVKIKDEIYALPNLQVEARWPAIMMQKKYVDKYNFDLSTIPVIMSTAVGNTGITSSTTASIRRLPCRSIWPWKKRSTARP
jgi:putative aldouronate transport system substrate-binding protein